VQAPAPAHDACLDFLGALLPPEEADGGAEASFGGGARARAHETAHLAADPHFALSFDAAAAAPLCYAPGGYVAAASACAPAASPPHEAGSARSDSRYSGGGFFGDDGHIGDGHNAADAGGGAFFDPLDEALRALPSLPSAEQMLRAARGGGGGGGASGGGGSSANGYPYTTAAADLFSDVSRTSEDTSTGARDASHPSYAAAGAGAAAAEAPDSLSALMASWHEHELCAPLAAVATPWVDVRIKLPEVAPADMPPQLRDALRALLHPSAVGVHAAVCPGCTLITLDAVVLAAHGGGASPADGGGGGGAEAAARALLSGPARRFFASQRAFALSTRAGDAVTVTRGGAIAPIADASQAPPALPLLPAALHSGVESTLRVSLPPRCASHFRVRCRVHGQFLSASLTPLPGGEEWQHALTLPPCGAAGVALIELESIAESGADSDAADVALHSGAPLRAVLLTPDAAIAAEVASLPPPASGAEADATAALIVCLGHALRHGARAPQQLVLAATRAALARGWHATAAALLPCVAAPAHSGGGRVIAASAASASASAAASGAPTLLHAALCAPAPLEALSLVLQRLTPSAAAATWAAAWAARSSGGGRGSVTPMHLAAAHASPAVALALCERLLRAFPGAAAAAWVACEDASGRTPSAVARSAHPQDAALRALDAAVCAAVAAAAGRMAAAASSARDALRARPHNALLAALSPRYRRRCARRALTAAHAALSARNDPLAAALATRALEAPPPSPAAPASASWRMPGAFADAAMEAAWLAHVARIMSFLDLVAYPCAAAGHSAQLLSVYVRAGGLPSALQAAYIVLVALLVPMLMRNAPAWFVRHREPVHAAMRLLGSVALPLWMPARQPRGRPLLLLLSPAATSAGGTPGAAVSLIQQFCTLFGMTFFSLAAVVRAPLHAALQGASFAITIGAHGILSTLPLRVAVSLLNLCVVIALERASRRAFAHTWAQRGAGKKHEE
jgi:hypothetical protein